MFAFSRRPSALLVAVLCAAVAVGFSVPDAPAPPPAQDGFHPLQQMFFLKKSKPAVERIGVIWKKGAPGQAAKLESMRRAAASIQGKLIVAYVSRPSEIASQYRQLTRKHDVEALWIVENDGLVDGSVPRQYLIENATKAGIPLLAPSKDWVTDGAPMAVEKQGDAFSILINEPAAAAAALSVPAEFKAQMHLVAAN